MVRPDQREKDRQPRNPAPPVSAKAVNNRLGDPDYEDDGEMHALFIMRCHVHARTPAGVV